MVPVTWICYIPRIQLALTLPLMGNIGAHGIDILDQDLYPYMDLAYTSNTLKSMLLCKAITISSAYTYTSAST